MSKLNAKQHRAIPFIVTSPTIIEGAKKAGVNPKTYYEWLKQPEFKAELDRQRNKITEEAFRTLEHSLTKAIGTLTSLLDTNDSRLKRLVCNDIIDHILQRKEIEDLDKRLIAIEQRLAE